MAIRSHIAICLAFALSAAVPSAVAQPTRLAPTPAAHTGQECRV